MRAFFWRTFQWMIGKCLGMGWSGNHCMACGEIHTIGALGSWRCPKLKKKEKNE